MVKVIISQNTRQSVWVMAMGLLLCRILPGKEYIDSTRCDNTSRLQFQESVVKSQRRAARLQQLPTRVVR